jgi:glycosyltransferase involved in cell wall biosynthesis
MNLAIDKNIIKFANQNLKQKRMLKIGIDASFLRKQDTGIGQVTVNFLQKLIKLESGKNPSKRVEFFLYLEEDVKLKLPKNFHKVVFLPPYKRDDIFRAIWWQKYLLPRKVGQDGCDIFLSMYQCATIMPKKIKHIMIVHDVLLEFFPQYLSNWRKSYFWKISKKAISKVDKIIAVSHRTEKDLINQLGVDPKKITVSYIDVDQIYKRKVSQVESKRVLKKYKLEVGYIYSGGGLEVRKNVENVIRAYKILLEREYENKIIPKLVISGKLLPHLAPLVTDVEKLIKELGLEKQVVVLGWVAQKDLPALYYSAALFVYPSLYEGFGLPVLEAMNQGAPVITSKTSSLPEVGSDSVLYCDPSDVEDLAMVLKNILSNDHLKTVLSMKGKERASHFSWEKFVRKLLNIVEELK